jgi:galactokinase
MQASNSQNTPQLEATLKSLQHADLLQHAPQARQAINEWVQELSRSNNTQLSDIASELGRLGELLQDSQPQKDRVRQSLQTLADYTKRAAESTGEAGGDIKRLSEALTQAADKLR